MRPDNACATPDIGNTRRFVSLPSFDLRATELQPLTIGCIALLSSHGSNTTAFLSLRLRNVAPLSPLSFFPFHFSVSMTNNETFNELPLRLHRYSLRGLSPRMLSELLCQSFSVSSLLLLFLELSS